MQHYSFELTPDPAKIEPLQEELQRIFQACGVRLKSIYAVTLALGEWLENVIQHGGTGGESRIAVLCAFSPSEIALTVRDSGRAFNPLEFPEIDTSLPSNERLFTGQGIHLIRKLMDTFSYDRRDGQNVFTMRKAVQAPNL